MPASPPASHIPRFRFGLSPRIALLASTLEDKFWAELGKQGKVHLTEQAKADIASVLIIWSEIKQLDRRCAMHKRRDELSALKKYCDSLAEMIKATQMASAQDSFFLIAPIGCLLTLGNFPNTVARCSVFS